MQKPRLVKDYANLSTAVQEQIKLNYPYGFDRYLIIFKNAKGKFVSALPYDTDEAYYLVRMTRSEALDIIEEDDDYNDDGVLKDEVMDDYEEKYGSEDDESQDNDDNDD